MSRLVVVTGGDYHGIPVGSVFEVTEPREAALESAAQIWSMFGREYNPGELGEVWVDWDQSSLGQQLLGRGEYEFTDTEVRFDRIDAQIAWAEQSAALSEQEGDASGQVNGARWNQDIWFEADADTDQYAPGTVLTVEECGTSCCIAGHAALDAGYRPTVKQREDHAYFASYIARYITSYITLTAEDGSERKAADIATEWLGLGQYDQGISHPVLFFADNTIEELKRIRDAYADHEHLPPRYTDEEKW